MVRFLVASALFGENGGPGRHVPLWPRSRRPMHRRFPGKAVLRLAPALRRSGVEAEAVGTHAPFSGVVPPKCRGQATAATANRQEDRGPGALSSGDRAQR